MARPVELASYEDLLDELSRRGISLTASGFTKSARQLYAEVASGESRLLETSHGLVREVRTAAVIIFDDRNRVLVERSYEVLGEPSVREHLGWSVAEKLGPAEGFQSAAVRALREELGVAIDESDLVLVGTERSSGASPAYPGIGLSNEIVRFAVRLDSSQVRDSYEERSADRVISWGWSAIGDAPGTLRAGVTLDYLGALVEG